MKHNETYETYGNSGLAKFNRNRVSCRWLWSVMLLFGFLGLAGWFGGLAVTPIWSHVTIWSV